MSKRFVADRNVTPDEQVQWNNPMFCGECIEGEVL